MSTTPILGKEASHVREVTVTVSKCAIQRITLPSAASSSAVAAMWLTSQDSTLTKKRGDRGGASVHG